MYFYKCMEYCGKVINKVPGYVCADLGPDTLNGLAYLSMLELKSPTYKMELDGLHLWPFDDIVGFKFDHTGKRYTEKQAYEILNNFNIEVDVTVGVKCNRYSTGFNKWNALPDNVFWAIKPGWLWNPRIKTGNLGESIITIPVKMTMLDGKELLTAVRYVSSFSGTFDKELAKKILDQAIESNVPYNDEFIKGLMADLMD